MTIIQPSGGSGAATRLADTTLGVAAATITFAAIPATSSSLMVICQGRGDTAAVNVIVSVQLNGDAGANYYREAVTASAGASTGTEGLATTSARIGVLPAATAPAGLAGSFQLLVPNYTDTVFNQTLQSSAGRAEDVTTGNIIVEQYFALWRNSAAVTQIVLLTAAGNFLAGTRATLYALS